ncbi:MAG: Lar family restriction alleviation protein [Bryobacteraceae bacterium]
MKLKPCPFCGSRKSEIVTGSYTVDGKKTETQNVLCGNCNAMGPDTLMGEDRAAQKWNRRRSARRSKPNTKVTERLPATGTDQPKGERR